MRRLKHTMPALGFQALQLVRHMAAERGAGVSHSTSLREVRLTLDWHVCGLRMSVRGHRQAACVGACHPC